MRSFLIISVFFVMGTSAAYSQILFSKTNGIKLLGNVDNHCYNSLLNKNPEIIIYLSKDSLAKFISSIDCRSSEPVYTHTWQNVNFTKSSIILINFSGVDCLSTFEFDWVKESENKFKLIITIKYGGCRAGGYDYLQLAEVPALPENAIVTQTVVYID